MATESFTLWVVIHRTHISWLQLAQELKFICPLRIKVDPYLLEAAILKKKKKKKKKKPLYFEIVEALQGVVKLLQ